MNYQIESVRKLKDELEPLIKKHWEEIALNKDKIKLNPDWDTYYKLEDLEMLHCYTARKDNVLVGYFTVVITKGLHYVDYKFGACDIIFISPEYRKGRAGANLIKYVEQDLNSKGVSVLAINTKVHAPFDKLLQKLDYSLIERIYSKNIGI